MYLRNLRLIDFKNYDELTLQFSPFINCFLGPNGAGKTNLLDAIHMLSLTKSFIHPIDNQAIRHDRQEGILHGEFELNGKATKVGCKISAGKKKVFMAEGKAYNKLSEHVGKFPLVLIAPNDTELIGGGSEERRKFFDALLSQLDSNYLQLLVNYQKALKQRNQLIKHFAENNRIDKDQLEPWDSRILNWGALLSEARQKLIHRFLPYFREQYAALTDRKEEVQITYNSDWLDADHTQKFKHHLQKDLILKRTVLGAHRDDYVFEIDGYPAKKYGSQGQQKSFLIALKLAKFFLLKKESGKTPILLLDDIFDKLDDHRISSLVKMAGGGAFGQVFITDARPERTLSILQQIPVEHAIFILENGQVQSLPDVQ
jgi:DNA replication and repair protein RecF